MARLPARRGMNTKILQDKTIYAHLPLMKYRGKVLPKLPYAVELKFNGEPNYLIVGNDNAVLVNKAKYSRVRTDCPVTWWAKQNLPKGIYLGELLHGDGRNFVTFNMYKDSDDLWYVIWDVLQMYRVGYADQPYFKRRMELERLVIPNFRLNNLTGVLKPTNPVHLAPQWMIKDENDLWELVDNALALGYEGMVVKNLQSVYKNGETRDWVKIKEYKKLGSKE